MKIKVTRNFKDKTKNKKLVKAGAVLTVSAERGKELIEKGFAEQI